MNQFGDRRLSKRYRIQFVVGVLLLGALVAPSLIHSAAAIGTLRNLPALWLPEEMNTRKEFFHFIDQFSVTDLVMLTWPDAQLNDSSIESAMEWLEPMSTEFMEDQDVPLTSIQDAKYGPILELSDGGYPFQWVRSGDQMVEELCKAPLNLKTRQAALRLRGSLVGTNLKQTCIVLSLDLRTLDNHRHLLPLIREGISDAVGCELDEIIMVGGPVDGAAIDTAAVRSIARFSLPSSVIAAVLCLFFLRSFTLSATIVAIAMVTQGMVLASFFYAGYDLNAVLMILPALVFVLTISAGIHLCNYFRESLVQMPEATLLVVVRAAMARGYKPCTLSVLTTVVGLLSLLLVRIQPVRLFGVAASGALLFALGMIFLMMPGAMLLTRGRFWFSKNLTAGKSVDCGGAITLDKATQASRVGKLLHFPLKHQLGIFLTFTLLAVITGFGLGRLKSSVRVPDMFAEQGELNKSYRWFEENLGPTMTGELLVAFRPDADLDAMQRYRIVYRLHAALAKIEGVGGINSCVTFMPRFPNGRSLASVATRAVMKSMIENETSRLYGFGFLRKTEQEEVWRLTYRLFQNDPVPASQRVQVIRTQAEQVIGDVDSSERPQVTLTGHVVIVEETQRVLLEDLIRSFAAAFLIIAIFMSIMVGNVVGGVLSMVPNMIPTLVLFGTMGWFGYSLDIGLVMTASVALGIAVDDTLHLLSHFRSARRQGQDLESSALGALRYCGLAMFQTTVICGCSLAIYFASEFKPTQRFAVFMGVLLAMAWLGVAVLLPAMMSSRLGRWLASR